MDKPPGAKEQIRDIKIRELRARKEQAEIAERKVLSRATREVLLTRADDLSLFDRFIEENLQKAKEAGREEIPADMASMYDLTPEQQREIGKQALRNVGLETSSMEADEETVQEIVKRSERLARSYLRGEFGHKPMPIQLEKSEGQLENIKLWSKISYEGTIYVVTEIKNGLDGKKYVLVPPDPAKEIETVTETLLKTELENGSAVLVSDVETTAEEWTEKDVAEQRWLTEMLAALEKPENKEAIVESGEMTEFFEKLLEETNEERRVNLGKKEQLMQKLAPIEKEYNAIELEMELKELTATVASATANLESLIKKLEQKKKNVAIVKFFDPEMKELGNKIARMNIELEQWKRRLKAQKEATERKLERVLGKDKIKEREEIKEALRTLEEQDSELEIKQKKVIDALNPAKQDSGKSAP